MIKFYCLHTLVGHEDWIRDIDVCQPASDRLLIASSSQDNYIRLWKLDSTLIARKEQVATKLVIEQDNAVLNNSSNNAKNAEQDDEEEEESEEVHQKKAEKLEEELKLKSSLFTIHSKKLNSYVQYSMNLESVLFGHEDWIYTVKFHPRIANEQPLKLISASMDKTMVVWSYDSENGVWIDVARAGEIGGNTLGFYGATFDQTSGYIVAHGYQGALHLWKRDLTNTNTQIENLAPALIDGGHFDLVEDVCWEPEQEYFLSVSKDQTSRFFGCWRNKPNSSSVTWHELGRPQIHGYDLKCAAFINRYKFVSGADEKLLRVFESPRIFLENYFNLSLDEKVHKYLHV
jgi:elongator complex protein 2